MIIAIFSTIIMATIVGLIFVQTLPKRMLFISALVTALILLNIINEILYFVQTDPFDWIQTNQCIKIPTLNSLILSTDNKQVMVPFITQQYLIMNALKARLQNGQNPIIQIDRINYNRLKQLLISLKDTINQSENYKFLEIDYKKLDEDIQQMNQFHIECLKESLLAQANNKPVLIVKNIQKLRHLENLKEIYLLPDLSVSIIFHKLPHSFVFSSLSKLTQLSAGKKIDYLQILLREYPQKKQQLQACAKAKQLDFNALLAVANGDLKRYCSIKQKSTPMISCIKSVMKMPDVWVPYMKVKKCFQKDSYTSIYGQFQGVKSKNGLISLEKQYYHADQSIGDAQQFIL